VHPRIARGTQIKGKSCWPLLDHLSYFPIHSTFFYLSTKHQSTKFSFRFGLDAGVARKALATSLVFRRESDLDVAVCRRPHETLSELHHDIRRLMALAYPKLTAEAREEIACDHFTAALNDPELALKIKERMPQTLDEAL